ncbi:MAG: tRNA uridine-5-carboxymethylaminomethyl(34) synthesis GTPase MnmE [Alphaproteobacteria bacterium]|nr:tRNA uridine-5-carboxymethylaminomethyl(34) synthesis GTPase MnmE [Alphaproteobacteria bacterium]
MSARPTTIFALASGAGRAGVAVLRISGPEAGPALDALAGRPASPRPKPRPKPRQAVLRRLTDPKTGVALDDALVLWFPAPASFTGQDVAELHVHGGPAVVAALAAALAAIPGLRLAEPGEFTRRAFENGKLDLAQAEGLADLIDAETEGQRRQALRQMEGALGARVAGWRDDLLRAMALVEAEIDFPDEDVPGGVSAQAAPILAALEADMRAELADATRGARVRDGYRIAILGAPNAGKSSLLNALAGREAAIVSDIPGTTRDVIEIRLVLAGFPVWIADTAGLREAADAIEAEGVRRALARAEEADLRLALVAPGDRPDPALLATLRDGDLVLRSKSDLAGAGQGEAEAGALRSDLAVSARTGEGVAALLDRLAARVAAALGGAAAPALTRARHQALVADAAEALARARTALAGAPELAGEDLRVAAHALGRLVGRIDVEDVLGEIFSSFCIGK